MARGRRRVSRGREGFTRGGEGARTGSKACNVQLHVQLQQEWARIVELEAPAGAKSKTSLWGAERSGREGMQERARSGLLMEAAAARRRRQAVPEYMRWEREEPPENAVALT